MKKISVRWDGWYLMVAELELAHVYTSTITTKYFARVGEYKLKDSFDTPEEAKTAIEKHLNIQPDRTEELEQQLKDAQDNLLTAYLGGVEDRKEKVLEVVRQLDAELKVYKRALKLAARHMCWGNSSVCQAPCSEDEQHDGKSKDECNKLQIKTYLTKAREELKCPGQ